MPFAGQQQVSPSKKVGEAGSVLFEFVSVLITGETISAAVTTATVYSGVDPTPAALISGSATILGSEVRQKLTGGVVGTIYELLCSITTSTGNTYQMSGLISVVPGVV